jgi:two-component system, OmpR family, alkaline phosphatase synthesis response regulator PhoP
MKLLCLSNDEVLGGKVCAEADRLNWSAVLVRDRSTIEQAVRQYDPDLLLIDIHDTADLEDWWKGATVPTKRPIIFLNQELSEEFLTKALDYGADAFIPKPLFSSRHFEARIKSMLRRQQLGQNKLYINKFALMVDSERYRAEIAGNPLDLTLTEFKILRELASEDSKVVSRLEIQTRVFGQAKLSNRSLDVHVCALRKKLKPANLDIDSVRGVGYRLSLVENQP